MSDPGLVVVFLLAVLTLDLNEAYKRLDWDSLGTFCVGAELEDVSVVLGCLRRHVSSQHGVHLQTQVFPQIALIFNAVGVDYLKYLLQQLALAVLLSLCSLRNQCPLQLIATRLLLLFLSCVCKGYDFRLRCLRRIFER